MAVAALGGVGSQPWSDGHRKDATAARARLGAHMLGHAAPMRAPLIWIKRTVATMIGGDEQVRIVPIKRMGLEHRPDPSKQVVVLPQRLVVVEDAVALSGFALHFVVEVRFLIGIAQVNDQESRGAFGNFLHDLQKSVDVGARAAVDLGLKVLRWRLRIAAKATASIKVFLGVDGRGLRNGTQRRPGGVQRDPIKGQTQLPLDLLEECWVVAAKVGDRRPIAEDLFLTTTGKDIGIGGQADARRVADLHLWEIYSALAQL